MQAREDEFAYFFSRSEVLHALASVIVLRITIKKLYIFLSARTSNGNPYGVFLRFDNVQNGHTSSAFCPWREP